MTLLTTPNAATPRAAVSKRGTAAIFPSAALASSGAWTRSSIVNVANARKIVLEIDYDAAAASGYPIILPLVSNADDQPAADADSWFQMSVWDGSITAGALTGTLATGSDFTLAANQGVCISHGLAVRLAASSGASDEHRIAIPLDVSAFKWFHFQAAEVGATGSPGTLAVLYSLAA